MDVINDFISNALSELTKFILDLMDLLPDSPFGEMMETIGSFDFLAYLNWFIPFDMALTFMNLWLAAIGTYYIYKYGKQIVSTLKNISLPF